jgi:hypothetical protein
MNSRTCLLILLFAYASPLWAQGTQRADSLYNAGEAALARRDTNGYRVNMEQAAAAMPERHPNPSCSTTRPAATR